MADYLWVPVVTPMTQTNLINEGIIFATENSDWAVKVGTTTGKVKVGAYKNNSLGFIIFASNHIYNENTAYLTYSSSGLFGSPITNAYGNGMWYVEINGYSSQIPEVTEFTSKIQALDAMNDGNWDGLVYPITYYPTNATLNGPASAAVGDTVNVNCTFPSGYTMKNPSPGGDIRVTNNGVAVPYTWDNTNKRVTFTMPDPS